MKKILSGYIIKEMLLYFLVCFLFFFLIFFVNQILLMAEDILSKKAPINQVALLILYAQPMIIATAAPFASLVGTLMAMGRLVSDREVLSMNALGISTRSIALPVLAVGVLIAAGSFLTNDILLPAGTIRYHRLYRTILTSTPALELESNSVKRNQNAIVISGTIQNGKMDSLLVIDSDKNGNRRLIASPEALIVNSDNPLVLMTLLMTDATITSIDRADWKKYDVIKASELSYNILLKNLVSLSSSSISPSEMASRDLYKELKKREQQSDLKVLNMYKMEFHKKFSIPFGAFFFVIIAFPLGLLTKNNGQSVGFIVGLIIAVLYWAMLIGGQNLSIRLGYNGTVMMWLPNLVVLSGGLALSVKAFFE